MPELFKGVPGRARWFEVMDRFAHWRPFSRRLYFHHQKRAFCSLMKILYIFRMSLVCGTLCFFFVSLSVIRMLWCNVITSCPVFHVCIFLRNLRTTMTLLRKYQISIPFCLLYKILNIITVLQSSIMNTSTGSEYTSIFFILNYAITNIKNIFYFILKTVILSNVKNSLVMWDYIYLVQ